jgi:hypothetical protein
MAATPFEIAGGGPQEAFADLGILNGQGLLSDRCRERRRLVPLLRFFAYGRGHLDCTLREAEAVRGDVLRDAF